MGGLQIRSCSNCRHSENKPSDYPCMPCLGLPDFPYWKSKRGAKAGSPRKPGAGRHEFEDRGELRRFITLSFKSNDIEKAGGRQKAKEYLEKKFYEKINKSN